MSDPRNLINGEPPRMFDPAHIAWMRERERIFGGERNIDLFDYDVRLGLSTKLLCPACGHMVAIPRGAYEDGTRFDCATRSCKLPFVMLQEHIYVHQPDQP